MTMTVTQSVITIAAVVLGTMTTRFLPFLIPRPAALRWMRSSARSTRIRCC